MSTIVNRWIILSLICICGAACGCDARQGADSKVDAPVASSDPHDDHDHSATGPHHGLLIELGSDEYHAEIVHDDQAGSVTIHLLDAAAKQSVTSDAKEVTINVRKGDQPAQFTLVAVSPDGQAATPVSEYTLASKELIDLLHDDSVTAKLNVTIAGQPFSGTIPRDDHAGHDHR